MKIVHTRFARWVDCHVSSPGQPDEISRRKLHPSLGEGTSDRPWSAIKLVERIHTLEWNRKLSDWRSKE